MALASLLYHAISADHIEIKQERHVFADILKDEFGLNDQQVKELYAHVKNLNTTVAGDMQIIDAHLKQNPYLRMVFM